jgi:hypothetical protein
MHWAGAGSRIAVALRRLRGRFGIAAPRVAVRTHIPWYWRGLAIVVMSAIALALAGWIYDMGRRFAGFDSSLSAQEVATLRSRVEELQAERLRLRGAADASESKIQIEQTTLRQLTAQVATLERENARLREDLAAFENLVQGEGKSGGLVLSRFRVEPTTTPGQYRFHLLAALNGANKSNEFNGVLRLIATVQEGGRDANIQVPGPNDPAAAQYQVTIKHFRKLEGVFAIPPGSRLKSVEARLMQGGAVKATQTVIF